MAVHYTNNHIIFKIKVLCVWSLTVRPLLQSLAIHYIYTIQYCICDPKYTLSTDSRFNEDSNSIIRVRQFLLKTENHAKKKCEKTERAKCFNNILETKVRYSSKMQIIYYKQSMYKYHSGEHHHRTSLQVCYQGQNRVFLACRKSQSQFSKCFICHSIYIIYINIKNIYLKKKSRL